MSSASVLEFEADVAADARLTQRAVGIASAISSWQRWREKHLEATLALADADLRRRCELISWLFPTGGRSRSAPDAPVIGRRELRALAEADPATRHALRRSFARVSKMLGLVATGDGLRWAREPQAWANAARHDRRVYRMLRCVHIAGLKEAQQLMRFLVDEMGGDPARADALSWYRHQVASR
jgi:hypothetical protein